MKKLTIGFIIVAVLALASPLAVYADPAIVIKPNTVCDMPGADANGDIGIGGAGLITHVVENKNRIDFTCKGRSLINLSGRGQHFAGFLCAFIAPSGNIIVTDNTRATVSANGRGTMHCVFKK